MSSTRMDEEAKYRAVWNDPTYRVTSPAFHRYRDKVLGVVGPYANVIEFGCGSGYLLAELSETKTVLGVDIAENCLNPEFDIPFKKACLWEPMGVSADVGFCVDVMEHIPTQYVGDVFKEIMKSVPKCFFIVCLLTDSRSRQTGKPELHLTVESASWWTSEAATHGLVRNVWSDHRCVGFELEREV